MCRFHGLWVWYKLTRSRRIRDQLIQVWSAHMFVGMCELMLLLVVNVNALLYIHVREHNMLCCTGQPCKLNKALT